jgi:hypothetical protein
LKVLLDGVFGSERFVNEVVWRRYAVHNDTKRFGRVHDVILVFHKGQDGKFNKQYQSHKEEYVKERFRSADADGRRWMEQNLSSPSPRPNLTYEYKALNGVTYAPPPNGWKYTAERMAALDAQGRLHYPKKKDARLRLKNYLDDLPGVPLQDVWDDVLAIGGSSAERLGYPTQKPEALLERIINASSNEGDIVLDPFCGCGTTVAVAQRLKRRWIGIDITHLAIGLIKTRLADAYGEEVKQTYEVVGEATTVEDARQLAEDDKFQFQNWALGLVGARPAGGVKKGADRGIDGKSIFHDGLGKTQEIIYSVKGGHLKATDVRDLKGVVQREKAAIGVLISLETPSKEMRKEAASGEFYICEWGTYPMWQLLTIEDLLNGKTVKRPPVKQLDATFKKAPKAKSATAEQGTLLE